MATSVHASPTPAVIPVYPVWGAAAGLVGGIGMGVLGPFAGAARASIARAMGEHTVPTRQ
ncbi:hypothetical protein [Streptomyces sp. JJ38]|uniref:hypothetical protein n=1 Tax=Streptomyces sp. JJ38 TaxID=2738128 RepID=UPI001C56D2BF|nr:hypothetical protein [Streptomyces sp. JJ38]MBW1598018.1 hypothetical protein [Streptomyces sp. JJ38]